MPSTSATHVSPRPRLRPALLTLLLATGALLGGCATSFQDSDPAYRLQADARPLPAAVPGSARVVVRWTQRITPEAQALLQQHWLHNNFDVLYESSQSVPDSDANPTTYMQIPADSAYYAAEFARLLARRMPAADIVLEPQALDVDKGAFVYKPLVRNRFPAQVAVDMWVQPHTYKWDVGGYMSVIYSISTAGAASPATCGVLGFKPGRSIMPAFDAAQCGKLEARDAPHPDLIYGFQSEKIQYDLAIPLKNSVPLEPGKAVGFPRSYEAFSGNYLEVSGAAGFDAGKSLENPTLEALAKIVADGMVDIDPKLSTGTAWERYVGFYDATLAQRLRTGGLQPGDDDKIAFIAKLSEAERAWVVSQNDVVMKNLLDGEFGKSFRATRMAMDKERTKQQMMGWAGVFMMAGAGLANAAMGGAGSSMAAMQVNMNAMQTAMQTMSGIADSSSAFYEKFGSEIAARQQVSEIDYGGKVVRVQAETLDKLYAELGQVYQGRYAAATPPKKTASRAAARKD